MKRLSLIAAVLMFMSMLTGCWDKVEIEDRLFVLAIGVDKVSEEEKSSPDDRYLVSFVSPIVKALKEGGEETFSTYKTTDSIFSLCLSNMYTRFAKKLSFGHLRVLLFGEDLVKDEQLFKEALDSAGRAHEFHKSMYVFVVPGKAEDVFEIKPKYTTLLAMYISGIADNSMYSDRISKLASFEMYNELSNQKGNTLIPRLVPQKDEVKITGAGVIKNYKLIGYVSETEYMSLNWIRNEADGGVIDVLYKNIAVPYRYSELKRGIKLDKVEGSKVYLTYSIESEGTIEEYIWPKDVLYQSITNEIEKKVEEKIIEESDNIIKKFKEEFQVDLIGAGEYLSKFHPQIYKQLEKDYDTNFKNNIIVNVTAEVKVRRVGVIE